MDVVVIRLMIIIIIMSVIDFVDMGMAIIWGRRTHVVAVAEQANRQGFERPAHVVSSFPLIELTQPGNSNGELLDGDSLFLLEFHKRENEVCVAGLPDEWAAYSSM